MGEHIIDTLVVGLCMLSVDVLLLCRVFAVVPPSRTSWGVLAAVYTFPVLNKVARLVIMIVYGVKNAQQSRLLSPISSATSREQLIAYESVWFITAADNA
jgi:hypothetical protein